MTSRADIIGPQAAAAEPASIERTARILHDRAELLRQTRTQIMSADASAWKGQGAEAFRARQRGPIPGKMEQVGRALEQGGDTLRGYSRGLEGLQRRADDIARRKDAAHRAVDDANRRASQATRAVIAEKRTAAHAVDPSTVAVAGRRVAAAVTAAGHAAAAQVGTARELALVEGQAFGLRNELQQLGRSHGTALHHAVGSEPAPGNALQAAVSGTIGAFNAKAKRILSKPKIAESIFRKLLKEGSRKGRPFGPKHPIWSKQGILRTYRSVGRRTNAFWNGVERQGGRLAKQGIALAGRGQKVLGGTLRAIGKAPRLLRKVAIVSKTINAINFVEDLRQGHYGRAARKVALMAVLATSAALTAVATGTAVVVATPAVVVAATVAAGAIGAFKVLDLVTNGMMTGLVIDGPAHVQEHVRTGEYGVHMKWLANSIDKAVDAAWSWTDGLLR